MKKTEDNQVYDLVIVGGGISGSSAAYIASHFTNMKKILVIEKNKKPGQVNSHRTQNSQTLHYGDIETNYSLEKATNTKWRAELVERYITKHQQKGLYRKTNKMVIGVGDDQIKKIHQRYLDFKGLFSDITYVEKEGLRELDPKLIEGRKSDISALVSPRGYAVNFGMLSELFINESISKKVEVLWDTKLESLRIDSEKPKEHVLKTNKGEFRARVVHIASGSHSLVYAHMLGYGLEYG